MRRKLNFVLSEPLGKLKIWTTVQLRDKCLYAYMCSMCIGVGHENGKSNMKGEKKISFVRRVVIEYMWLERGGELFQGGWVKEREEWKGVIYKSKYENTIIRLIALHVN